MDELTVKKCYLCGKQFRVMRKNQVYCDEECNKLQNRLWRRGISMDAFVDGLMTEPKAQTIEVLNIVKEYILNKHPECIDNFNQLVLFGDLDRSGLGYIEQFKKYENCSSKTCADCEREYQKECGCAKLINFGYSSQYRKVPDNRCVNRERRVYA